MWLLHCIAIGGFHPASAVERCCHSSLEGHGAGQGKQMGEVEGERERERERYRDFNLDRV